ncbi:thioredoxin-dependent thiol peroxidase [Salicibibacter cibi]|uniref:thioredoxin-dependent peroxiredoxin n=1 Tax=Salicibibacter cibi TaxID=2743001 RepID=A0A7T7CF02_9BACI|nr:thioredoxin-dependent thiol peroxidase [Salicibibacter cibi]QQK79469.1 thioredoxin-dependent thiol peroxidase [Salicibibacter cibi]
MDLTDKQAPDFTLQANDGTEVTLSDYRGQTVVLYFYPKDMTPGCTTQACDFRDAIPDLQAEDVVVLGVSPDPIEKHEKFASKHELPFLLLSDPEQDAANKYGVWQLKKNFGKESMGIVRSTFVINPDGVVTKEWRKVRVDGHVDEVRAYLTEKSEA